MFLHYKDQATAEEVESILKSMQVPVEMECSCIRDHGQEQCLDMGSSCRGGRYLTVSDIHSQELLIVSLQVKRENIFHPRAKYVEES